LDLILQDLDMAELVQKLPARLTLSTGKAESWRR